MLWKYVLRPYKSSEWFLHMHGNKSVHPEKITHMEFFSVKT